MPERRAREKRLPHSPLGDREATGKRSRPAAVGSPTGCRRASWKVRKKSGAGQQTSPPPLELTNRYQALAEESDSETETDSDCESIPLRPTGKQGMKPLPITSAHTGNGVMADGGRKPPKVIPQLNNPSTSVTPRVTQKRGRAMPIQSDLVKSKSQAPQSASTDQIESDKGDGLATSSEGPSGTRPNQNSGQSVPENGQKSATRLEHRRRPAVSLDESAQVRDSSSKAGQNASAADRKSASDPERSKQAHEDEPPGQSGPTPDDMAWMACTAQPLDRPFGPSYFIPGRVEGKPTLCLIDTGCTTNLLGKHVFDRLPERLKEQLVECETHGMMADGTRLPFYGVVQVRIRLKELLIEERLVVSRISEDVILGMPFLARHSCTIDFNSTQVIVDGRQIECTDRHGRQLASSIQVIRETTIPPETEMTLQCRVTAREYCPVGLIEGRTDGLCLATSVNRPDHQAESWYGA